MDKTVKATMRLARYCEDNNLLYGQPSRYNLEEDYEFVKCYDDDGDVIWKYSIENDKIIFSDDSEY